MYFLDVFDGLMEEETAAVCLLEIGQDIDLLEVEEVFPFGLHGDIARRLAFFVGQEVDVPFFFHLFADVLGGVHPVHHVVNLFFGQNFLVSLWKDLPGQLVDELAVGCVCFSDSKHRCCIF